MKLKTPLMLGLSLCMTLGVCFSAAACGDDTPDPKPTHTEHVDSDKDGKCDKCGKEMESKEPDTGNQNDAYTVTIEAKNTSVLSSMSVLFFSDGGTSELKELKGATSVSAELPAGDYIAYLVGNMPGYTQTPAFLTSSSRSGKIKVDAVETFQTDELEGGVPTGNKITQMYYQILVLYPDGKTVFKGPNPDAYTNDDPDNEDTLYDSNTLQVCTKDASGACYTIGYDEKTNLAWFKTPSLDDTRDWGFFAEAEYEVHISSEYECPEGYSFDNQKYTLPKEGGFFTVQLDSHTTHVDNEGRDNKPDGKCDICGRDVN